MTPLVAEIAGFNPPLMTRVSKRDDAQIAMIRIAIVKSAVGPRLPRSMQDWNCFPMKTMNVN